MYKIVITKNVLAMGNGRWAIGDGSTKTNINLDTMGPITMMSYDA